MSPEPYPAANSEHEPSRVTTAWQLCSLRSGPEQVEPTRARQARQGRQR
jgi:hypothetical protein